MLKRERFTPQLSQLGVAQTYGQNRSTTSQQSRTQKKEWVPLVQHIQSLLPFLINRAEPRITEQ